MVLGKLRAPQDSVSHKEGHEVVNLIVLTWRLRTSHNNMVSTNSGIHKILPDQYISSWNWEWTNQSHTDPTSAYIRHQLHEVKWSCIPVHYTVNAMPATADNLSFTARVPAASMTLNIQYPSVHWRVVLSIYRPRISRCSCSSNVTTSSAPLKSYLSCFVTPSSLRHEVTSLGPTCTKESGICVRPSFPLRLGRVAIAWPRCLATETKSITSWIWRPCFGSGIIPAVLWLETWWCPFTCQEILVHQQLSVRRGMSIRTSWTPRSETSAWILS